MGRDWDPDNIKDSKQSYEEYLNSTKTTNELSDNLEARRKEVIGTSFPSTNHPGWIAIVMKVSIDWSLHQYEYEMELVNPESGEFMKMPEISRSLAYPEKRHYRSHVRELEKEALGTSLTSSKYPGWVAVVEEILPYGYKIKLSHQESTEPPEEIIQRSASFPESRLKWKLKEKRK